MRLNAKQVTTIAQSLGRRRVKAQEAAQEFGRRANEIAHAARVMQESGMELTDEQLAQFIGRANALIVEYHDSALAVEMYGADTLGALVELADREEPAEEEPVKEEEVTR